MLFLGFGTRALQAVSSDHTSPFAESERPPVAAEKLFVEEDEPGAEFAGLLELAKCRVVA